MNSSPWRSRIVSLFGLWLSLAVGFGAEPAATAAIPFSVVPEAAPRAVPPFFLGAGTEYIYNINNENAKLNTPEEFDVLRDLGMQALRGPAGSPSNHYLWKKGHMFTSDDPEYGKYYEKEHNKGKGEGSRPIFVPELMTLAGKLNVPYIFAVNVVSQTPAEIAELVTEMKKHTKQPIFLEMGNELFEPGEGVTAFPTCEDYVRKVREINRAVKAVDPAAQTGVVCPSYPFPEKSLIKSALREQKGTGNLPIDRYLEWDDILAANSDAFDAVILHPYVFFRPENMTPESLMAYMFAWNEMGEQVLTADYANTFPDKTIWITEFNVLTWSVFNEKNPERKSRYQLMKSPGAAIVNMETVLRFLDAGNVSMTFLHTFKDGQGFGIVQPGPNGFDKLPNYYVYEEMGRLFSAYPQYFRLQASNAPSSTLLLSFPHITQGPEQGFVDIAAVGAWGFGTEQGISQALFLNRTPYPQTVSFPGAKLRQLWQYGGREPFPDFLRNSRNWTHLPATVPAPDQTQGQWAETVTLAPYTMTTVELGK